jgi:hypothetical protein
LKPGFGQQIWSFEGLGTFVVPIDEGVDIGYELPDRGVKTSTEPLSGELGKRAFDLIDK